MVASEPVDRNGIASIPCAATAPRTGDRNGYPMAVRRPKPYSVPPTMNYWRSPAFYGSFLIISALTFIVISLFVEILGGAGHWSIPVLWVVSIAIGAYSLYSGYSQAVTRFKKRTVQNGFPVIIKPPSGPAAG